MKLEKKQIIHLVVILLGILWIAIPVFHHNLWFDEAYSVGMANHTFGEIWSIGGNDVHPVLYYWILHIINLLFGNQVMAYRIFSMLCTAILGILGYTHIRKDFGEKVGFFFSFLTYFFPINMVYAGEIRMYSLAMLLVTLMAIYAYRIYRKGQENSIKSWILFGIFSLASAYTHYYGLMTAGIINILLFLHFVIEARKKKEWTFAIKAFIVTAVIQIALYIPWLVYLMLQVSQVSSGFWIGIHFPDTFIEFFTFQFTGNLGDSLHIGNGYAAIFGFIICGYMIYLYVKNKKQNTEMEPALLAIKIYGGIILAACLVSLIIWRPIIYARYMLCVTGLFLFFLSDTMAMKGNKRFNVVICALCVILSGIIMMHLIESNYDASNAEVLNYVEQYMQEGDIILHANEGSGFVIDVHYSEHTQYFWDRYHWNVEAAYQAFGEMHTIYELEELENYQGRIWIIEYDNSSILDSMIEKYNVEIMDEQQFSTKYHEFQYHISVVEKK